MNVSIPILIPIPILLLSRAVRQRHNTVKSLSNRNLQWSSAARPNFIADHAMQRRQARQRKDSLYRRALTLQQAEIAEKRAKLRASLATRLSSFAKEIRLLLPTSIRLNRGNLILPNLVQSAQASGLSDVVLLHEHRGTPTALTLSHFPHGPTVSFSLHNVVLRHDIPNSSRGTVSESYPHLIFEGFTSRLGLRIVKILKHIFPPREAITNKTKLGSRVVTFKNIEDSIEVRHHVFVKTSYQSVELAEVGPRMTMRCFEIRGGTLENKDGDVEWRLNQYTRTSRMKDYL